MPVKPEYKGRGDALTMKALAWFGTTDVRLIDAPVPDITQDDDVILKVTGTTVCGSDNHLKNGEIVTLQKGDILGHEVHLIQCGICAQAEGYRLVHGKGLEGWT